MAAAIPPDPPQLVALLEPGEPICQLWDFGVDQYLVHRITGETVRMYGDGSKIEGGPFRSELDDGQIVLVGEGSDEDYYVHPFQVNDFYFPSKQLPYHE
jgi:hypothetical protein